MSYLTDDYDYQLAPELIAQQPLERRDQSRLMVLDRATGQCSDHHFFELPKLLRKGDLLVTNDTRVVPARFAARRATCGRIEGLFLQELEPGIWLVMLKGAGKCQRGEMLVVEAAEDISLTLEHNDGWGQWQVRVTPAKSAGEVLDRAGQMPLPPYIRRAVGDQLDPADRATYQTVYAKTPGAVAAPTAGLHFTPAVFDELSQAGVEVASVTLHVGAGTFLPVKVIDVRKHVMHREWYEITSATAQKLNAARSQGRRIIAVGTTSMRVLETAARGASSSGAGWQFSASSGWTDIFIYPPAAFLACSAMITNFHLPKSTLLMLVSAFCAPDSTAGIAMIRQAYARALRNGYRFYSYGDAMLIQ